MRYQLHRFGEPYCAWNDDRDELIRMACKWTRRPWWWLRLCGWHIREDAE